VFAQLKTNLERPVYGRQALEWRLRGMIGVEALAERWLQEVLKCEAGLDEGLLTLADFLIVLREVDYKQVEGSITNADFEREYSLFLSELSSGLAERIAEREHLVAPDLMTFWKRVVDECRA
jgi:hypothetical protein